MSRLLHQTVRVSHGDNTPQKSRQSPAKPGRLPRARTPAGPPSPLRVVFRLSFAVIRETGTDGAAERVAFVAILNLNLPCPVRGQRRKNSDRKLNEIRDAERRLWPTRLY